MRKVLYVCLLASISAIVRAQNISIIPEVTSHDERAVVEYDNKICATEEATVIYRVSIEDSVSIESVTLCQYTFNEEVHDASFTLENGVVVIDEISVPLIIGSNLFSFNITYEEKDKEDPIELTMDATTIQIYPKPAFGKVTEPSTLTFYKETGKLNWTVCGEGGAYWVISWTSTENSSGNGESFVHPSIINKGASEKNVTVTLNATNYAPDSVTVWENYSEYWTITIWPEISVTPSVTPNSQEDPSRLFQGESLKLAVSMEGGYAYGWKVEWRDVDNNKELSNELEYNVTSSGSDIIETKHILLHVKNTAPNGTNTEDVLYDGSFHYYIVFYPIPIVQFEKEYPKNIKHGDKVVLSLTVKDSHGNSMADAYDLSCSWNKGESVKDFYELVGNNQNNNDGQNITISVDCSATLKGTNLKQTSRCEADFVVWPLPIVTATNIEDFVGYGGQSCNFSVSTIGGEKDGWSYVWTQNNQVIDVNSNTFNLTLENTSATDSIVNEYKVRVSNKCDEDVWFENDYSFRVTVYPEPKVPERIFVMDQNRGVEVTNGIREGNNIILHCDECTGGNPNAWSYIWSRNNSELGDSNEIIEVLSSIYSGNGKANDMSIEYICDVENTYNSVLWKKQEYKKEIRVYRRPLTPTKLQKKGNGTSGTWVATCSIDDSSLGAYDYYLIFGYRDENGNMHDLGSIRQENVGEQRWSNSMGNINGNAYVYALWKYDDGAEITSGLCMEYSIDESWDRSTYDGSTRSVIAEATGINKTPTIQTQEKMEYYSLDGQKSFQPRRGINIVRTNDGTTVKIVNNK